MAGGFAAKTLSYFADMKMQPQHTSGNGSKCLYNALSQCLYGHDGRAQELENVGISTQMRLLCLALKDSVEGRMGVYMNHPRADQCLLAANRARNFPKSNEDPAMAEVGDILAFSAATGAKVRVHSEWHGDASATPSVAGIYFVPLRDEAGEDSVPSFTVDLLYSRAHYSAIVSTEADPETGVFLSRSTDVSTARQILLSPPGSYADTSRVDAVFAAIAGVLGLTRAGGETKTRRGNRGPRESKQWEQLLLTKLAAANAVLVAAKSEYEAATNALAVACSTADVSMGMSGNATVSEEFGTLEKATLQVRQAESNQLELQAPLLAYQSSLASKVGAAAVMIAEQDASVELVDGTSTPAVQEKAVGLAQKRTKTTLEPPLKKLTDLDGNAIA